MSLTHGGDIYGAARSFGWDWRDVLDASASINPLGPAPGVAPAICGALERIVHYPDREPMRLNRALAKGWEIAPEQILPGNGATELIWFLARIFRGAPVTLAAPVFSEFHRAFPEAALCPLTEPSAWPRRGLLVLTRPANPTGWSLPLDAVEARLSETQEPAVMDESFIEFTGLQSAVELLRKYPHLIVLRSLTKFYALPGLRVGAIVGSEETMERLRRYREPWQVNVLAEEAALAAIADSEHQQRSIEFVRSERVWLHAQISGVPGTEPMPGDANYLFVWLRYPAAALCEHMLRRKILIRNCAEWPGLAGEAVRIAVRRRDENERLLGAWSEFQWR
jgi:threonine-phosphate decarboxylase